jgi:D-inositol-3-phosphate glycosyltransferase
MKDKIRNCDIKDNIGICDTEKKIRVLHITTDFPFMRDGKICSYGGLGLCVEQLVSGLLKCGLDVDILSRKEKDIEQEIVIGRVYRTRFIKLSNSRDWKLTHSFTLIPTFLSLLWMKDYDIIHAHNPPAALFSIPIARLLGKKTVLTMHGPWSKVRDRFKALAKIIEWFAVSCADVVTFDSLSLFVSYRGNGEFKVVSNAVDTVKFKKMSKWECRKKLNLPIKGRLILYSGRSVYGKNVDALRLISKEFRNAKLVFAGSDIKDDSVINLGVVSNSDMPYVYNACDCLVLDSSAEGMSRAVLEAMSCECPVFLSSISSNYEILGESKGGIIFDDKYDLISKFNSMRKGELRSMGVKARKRAVTYLFSISKRVNKFLDIYIDLLSKKQ